jgi:hypothetical protein
MFYTPKLIFGGTKGVRSCFHVLPAWTRFRRYRGRQLSFSCLARTDSFSAIPRASGPVFMFCAQGHVFDGEEGVRSRFHVLRSRTCFRWYRGRRLSFSYFACPDSFSTISRMSRPVFMFFLFCILRHVFGGAEGVSFYFHVLRSRTSFRQYRGCRHPFSLFARTNSFSAVLTASGPVFLVCAPELDFDGTEGVESHFHVLRVETHFRRYRGRRVRFSCFAPPKSFSAVSRASPPVFMFCISRHIFSGAEGVGTCFQVLRSRSSFRRNRGRQLPFSCFARSN